MSGKFSLRLDPMTDEEFDAYSRRAIEEYAKESPHFRERPFAEAVSEVRGQFARRLPQGPATPGCFLLAVRLRDEENGGERQIGFLDIGESPIGSKNAYIWNIGLDLSVRGRGYGKAALALTEAYLRERGYVKIGLNVFADNTVARRIYDDAGFAVTQMNMEKKL